MYILDVKVPDQTPRKLSVHDQILAGLDPRNDLILVDPAVEARHFHFKNNKEENLLTVQILGSDNSTLLNGVPLEKGKSYLLEKGDTLKCGRVEIKIRFENAPARPPEENRNEHHQKQQAFLNDLKLTAIESPVEETIAAPPSVPLKEKDTKKQESHAQHPHLGFRKIPWKIYGFLFDVLLTYFILAFVLPASGVLPKVQSLFYPVTEFLTSGMAGRYPEFTLYLKSFKILSVLEFFLFFHLIMIAGALFLGNTPGAFLLGLRPQGTSFLGRRFKAYVYGLLNIFLLPLIVFDLPLISGKTLKEWLTFYNRDMATSTLYRLSRTTLVPALILFFFFSPLFLKFPFSAVVVEDKILQPRYKDVHVRFVSSVSSVFGTELKSELNSQYSLLPSFSQGKTGLTLFDHSSGKALVVTEDWRMDNEEALYKLRFSNPLSSLYLPNENLGHENLKLRAYRSLMVSPIHFVQAFRDFGPFLGNGVLFKHEFAGSFLPQSGQDSILAMPFNEKNPFLLLSSGSAYRLYWFTPKGIIAYTVSVPHQTKLLEHFTRDILSGMRFNQAYGNKLSQPQILEVLDAFERENHQTLLTYYIYEAKNSHNKNPVWRAFLKKNILQTKLALNGTTHKNIEKSFDDILNSIQ